MNTKSMTVRFAAALYCLIVWTHTAASADAAVRGSECGGPEVMEGVLQRPAATYQLAELQEADGYVLHRAGPARVGAARNREEDSTRPRETQENLVIIPDIILEDKRTSPAPPSDHPLPSR